MTRKEAIEFAVKQIPQIVPIDEDNVRQLCENIVNQHEKDPEAIAQRFLEILGPADMSFNFVLQFNEKLSEKDVKATRNVRSPIRKGDEKPSTDQSLEPLKLQKDAKISTPSLKPQPSQPTNHKSVLLRKNAVPANPKSKKSSKLKKLQNLQEIDDVLKMLEIEQSESDSSKYACNCQGNRHPLFEVASNCLSCGKIICAREGLHLNNCSFCGAELIPLEERMKIMDILNKEKQELESKKTQENDEQKPKKTKTYKISSGTGTNLFSAQDKLFDKVEKDRERKLKREEVLKGIEEEEAKIKKNAIKDSRDPELFAAQDRLENLLHFQETSAERTKIIDNASDFSMDNEVGVWGSAYERALLLKKQQRNLRKWERLERERHGKRDKLVLDLSIGKDGKVSMTEVTKNTDKTFAGSDDDIENISDDEDAQDLTDIKALKGEISERKQETAEKLQSNVWDYQKDKKQFRKPRYIGSKQSDEAQHSSSESSEHWKPKVQVNESQDGSLEQNILAVL